MNISTTHRTTTDQYTKTSGTEDLNQEKSGAMRLRLHGKVDIDSLVGSAVKLEISAEGLKTAQNINLANRSDFSNEIVQLEGTYQESDLPEYSGIYSADKAISEAVENCDTEEKAFVYGIIRGNFLISNSGDMAEEERQANINLGMEKAEYAANNYISEENRQSFLNAMKTIANLAVSGRVTSEGEMDYGIYKGSYLGTGSNLVRVDNETELMKQYDAEAYKTYKNLMQGQGTGNGVDALRYLLDWSGKNYYERAERDNQQYLKENKILLTV